MQKDIVVLNNNMVAKQTVLLPGHRLIKGGLRCNKHRLPSVNVSFGDTFSVTGDIIRFDIKQLEKEAKNLGVKASYGNNVSLGNLVNEALVDVKNAGYKLPKKIVYGGNDHRSDKAAYFLSGVIYLNPDYDWSELKDDTKRYYKNGVASSDNPKHILYHEIAHAIHARTNPIRFYMQMACPTPMNQFDQSLIFLEVSSYATNSVFDFVAEVFAGRMAGKVYSEEINNIYNELGGPKPIKSK